MTKKQLRQRLIDIAAGAGMYWEECYELWECEQCLYQSLELMIEAIDRTFNIEIKKSRISKFSTINKLTDYVFELIKFKNETLE